MTQHTISVPREQTDSARHRMRRHVMCFRNVAERVEMIRHAAQSPSKSQQSSGYVDGKPYTVEHDIPLVEFIQLAVLPHAELHDTMESTLHSNAISNSKLSVIHTIIAENMRDTDETDATGTPFDVEQRSRNTTVRHDTGEDTTVSVMFRRLPDLMFNESELFVFLATWFLERGILMDILEPASQAINTIGRRSGMLLTKNETQELLWLHLATVLQQTLQCEYNPKMPWRWQEQLFVEQFIELATEFDMIDQLYLDVLMTRSVEW